MTASDDCVWWLCLMTVSDGYVFDDSLLWLMTVWLCDDVCVLLTMSNDCVWWLWVSDDCVWWLYVWWEGSLGWPDDCVCWLRLSTGSDDCVFGDCIWWLCPKIVSCDWVWWVCLEKQLVCLMAVSDDRVWWLCVWWWLCLEIEYDDWVFLTSGNVCLLESWTGKENQESCTYVDTQQSPRRRQNTRWSVETECNPDHKSADSCDREVFLHNPQNVRAQPQAERDMTNQRSKRTTEWVDFAWYERKLALVRHASVSSLNSTHEF